MTDKTNPGPRRAPSRNGMSRRTIVKAAAAGTVAALASSFPKPAISQGLRPIKITLPWIANGSNSLLYVAKDQEFFKKRGIDPIISRGFGSVAAAQAVGAGEFDFGLIFPGGSILGAARGLPLMITSTLSYDATMGIAVRADSSIKTPKDLEGKKIGIVPSSAEAPYWPAFARKAGVDLSKVTTVQMDNRVLEQSVINRQVDAITAIATSSLPLMLALKEPCRFMLWSKLGVTLYAFQIVTRRDLFLKDKELCRAVNEAAAEGLAFALKDPEAAIDIFLKNVPEVGLAAGGRENARISQALMHYTVLSPEAEGNSIGYTDMKKAADMIDLVMEFGAPKDAKKPVLDELFTNEFAGKTKLTSEQWARVKNNVATYDAILR